ncbi:MAG: hypothetical protein ACI8VT_000962 [Saprospiraceae bacterium]|jgi:hypothetical protein
MDQKTYLTDRVDDQINWYTTKSKFNQNRYKLLKTVIILVSVTIPFLAGLIKGEGDILKIAVGVGGILIAGFEGILSLYKYQDLWLQYRLTAEMLEREKILFVTEAGPYENNPVAFKQFVTQAESIMSAENKSWLAISKEKKEKET